MTALQKEVIKLLKDGLTPSEVSKKLNRTGSTISSVIKRFNIINYNTVYENKVIHNYFDDIDNDIKAYLLGFFIADGWISEKNRFGITIQSDDDYILKYYQLFSSTKIFKKNRTTKTIKRKTSSTIRWTSEYMKDIFRSYNILTNKTYNIEFIFPFDKIPKHLVRHFIRGFIDGDGSFEANKGIFTITLVNTSLNFMKQIGIEFEKINEGIESTITKVIGKTVDYYTLRFNFFRINKPEKVLQIYNYLYKDTNIFLSRKKEKIESYLKYRGKL